MDNHPGLLSVCVTNYIVECQQVEHIQKRLTGAFRIGKPETFPFMRFVCRELCAVTIITSTPRDILLFHNKTFSSCPPFVIYIFEKKIKITKYEVKSNVNVTVSLICSIFHWSIYLYMDHLKFRGCWKRRDFSLFHPKFYIYLMFVKSNIILKYGAAVFENKIAASGIYTNLCISYSLVC